MSENGEANRPVPSVPPMPDRPPEVSAPLADWLRMPRPDEAPLGVWRAGYVPRPAEEPERTPAWRLAVGAVLALLLAWVVWSLLWGGYLGGYWLWPLAAITPDEWMATWFFVVASWLYYGIVAAILLGVFGRLGQWPECARRVVAWLRRQQQQPSAAGGLVPRQRVPAPDDDPAAFGELRRDGALQEAEHLARALEAGQVSDVDWARITHAWRAARGDERRRAALLEEVRRRGAGAAVHGSGARDLQPRGARHDVVLHQVRLGAAADVPRNPFPYRTAGIAVAPEQLATGLLAVGPSGSGKTTKVVRPIVESLCVQALSGQAAVVLVTTRGDQCAPRGWFDVIIDTSDGGTTLDLFGSGEDPDEAAALAAEALVGDLQGPGAGHAAITLLAQLIGPYRAVHGLWPSIPDLRDLLAGDTLERLRAELEAKSQRGPLRELAAAQRQVTAASNAVAQLADRAALLDRPALAPLVGVNAGVTPLDRLDKPVRVRVDLPERTHHEAGRILARLVLAQFAAAVPHRHGGPFACLVLDEAAGVATPAGIQALHRLRSAGAGVVLALRTLEDVGQAQRAPLVAAVGCRAVLAGVGPRDGQHFAEAWGTEWVEDVSITNRELVADEPMQKVSYGLRKLLTGRDVTARAVTTSRTRRQRWPADDLATEIPGGHAVLSVTAAGGERSSPILVALGR